MDIDRMPSPPRPAPSASRMALSALVNSPPPASPPRTTSSRLPDHHSTRQPSSAAYYSGSGYPPASDSRMYDSYTSRSSRDHPSDYYGVPADVGRSYLHRGADLKMPASSSSSAYRASAYDRHDRLDRLDRGDRLDRHDRLDRVDRLDRDRLDRHDRLDRLDRHDRVDHLERDRLDRDRLDHLDRLDRLERLERLERQDRLSSRHDLRDRYDPRDIVAVERDPYDPRDHYDRRSRSSLDAPERDPYDDYDSRHRHVSSSRAGPSSAYRYRSPSPPPAAVVPAYQPFEPTGWGRNGRGDSPEPPRRALQSSASPRRRSPEPEHDLEPELEPEQEPERDLPTAPGNTGRKGMLRPDDSLTANEEVWQDHLRTFQQRREKEANQMVQWTPELNNGTAERKPPVKRKGWPADHPTRVAQRQAKEAAIAAGIEIPKKKYKRKSKASMPSGGAGLDDELLGLAEGGETKPSSPMPPSSVIDGDEGREDSAAIAAKTYDPNSIVWPCGLTRAEVMLKVESGNIKGLTEDDVKQVQDEMWLKKNGPAQLRKDGTMRKKPGPAKGWKAMRRMQERVARGDGPGGEDSDADSLADRSMAASVGGDPDADIAALLEEEPPKPKKRRKKTHTSHIDAADEAIISELEEMTSMQGDEPADHEMSGLENGGDTPVAPKKRSSKAKEPGVGKGRWTRPPKGDKESKSDRRDRDGGDLDDELTHVEPEPLPPPPPPRPEYIPNSYDPRGISEGEAQVRLSLVDELQRQVWASITRDVPRVYRVMQAYDNATKQDCLRTAQAAVRNGFSQRNLKPTYRSSTKANKDAVAKGKKVMREMLVYWKKNEKEELAARKRAEKEALEKAKAEEEAREAKRQSRKLNFLLTQTELYSHFIGKKIKTSEAENMDGETVTPAGPAPEGAEHENFNHDEPLKDLDYDEDDDENLRRHAARGAQAAIQANRDRAAQFDASAKQQNGQVLDDDTMDGDELNFQNPSLGDNSVTITQPKMLMAQLKEYQLKGLTWLGNLYEQGINGILADEMGLGKTIQSISLLAYLAESHNLWGPFLVIAPASTLHNWQQELTRFVPRLKALPYWGSPKDRETLRRIWNKKNQTFTEDSPFHILVTSYQLAVQDEKYFHGMKWQYMVLDEAQAIKSSSSARWKSLLSIDCRNRLLLTGTPIQNSMHELWALLHFIMPQLFDSHEEFAEWFSKDIENAASGNDKSQLKPEQLKRLHMILKPFMLRRVKKHVQKELGDKIEIDLLVDLSGRQRKIYKALRQRVSIADLIAQANNSGDTASTKSLMNLVMQFRKVCNHPDLFERADVVSPYLFGSFSQSGNLARQGDLLYCPNSSRNAIEVSLPRLIWTDGGKLDVPGEDNLAGTDTHILNNLLNIWNTDWINSSLKENESEFAFLKIMDMSPAQARRRAKSHPLVSILDGSETPSEYVSDRDFAASSAKKFTPLAPRIPTTKLPDHSAPALSDITAKVWNQSYFSRRGARFAVPDVVAPPITPALSNRSYTNTQQRLALDPIVQSALYGVAPSERDDSKAVARLDTIVPHVPPAGLLGAAPQDQVPLSSISVPQIKRMIVDSAKLARLDDLLRELKDGGHRVLLYFQMTKMMDLIEEYLIYRQYKYLRLDGSSAIGDRRDMVTSWQTNPDIFVFCLSTRAGGLGINLTAADTVVFYDHDWNPSNDAQAMDRAHRVGQTKQVTVYRLIARGTIEERIVKLARAKKDVQDIVVGQKSINDVAKPAEIASLFMDDEELAESVAKRKQAEAHGYTGGGLAGPTRRSAFGDGLGSIDDDDDDFFTAANKNTNTNAANDDEDMDENRPASGARTPVPKKRSKKKDSDVKPRAKKVKIALGPDGLPI